MPLWSNWITLTTQQASTGNSNHPGILEVITNWPEAENFRLPSSSSSEKMTHAVEVPPYNQLPTNGKEYDLFIDSSFCITGRNQKQKAAIDSPI